MNNWKTEETRKWKFFGKVARDFLLICNSFNKANLLKLMDRMEYLLKDDKADFFERCLWNAGI